MEPDPFGAARDAWIQLASEADPFAGPGGAGQVASARGARTSGPAMARGPVASTGRERRIRTGATRRPSTGRPLRARGIYGPISPAARSWSWADIRSQARRISSASAPGRLERAPAPGHRPRGPPPAPAQAARRAARPLAGPRDVEDRARPEASARPAGTRPRENFASSRFRRRPRARAREGPAFAFGAPDLDPRAELSPSRRAPLALATDPSAALALATERTGAPAAGAPARPPPLPSGPLAPALAALAALDERAAPEPSPRAAAPPAPQVAPSPSRSRSRSRPGSRLASLLVNAVALAALLALALAIVVVWRGGRLEAAAFRPAAIIAALRHGAAAGPFVTAGVRSGLYQRERGAPLLFVRGEVVSRAPAAVRAVRVVVEVVREGTVVARGEALAGAVPTAEELWRVQSTDALERVARTAAGRTPERIAPGDEVPFLVAFDEYPPESRRGGAARLCRPRGTTDRAAALAVPLRLAPRGVALGAFAGRARARIAQRPAERVAEGGDSGRAEDEEGHEEDDEELGHGALRKARLG